MTSIPATVLDNVAIHIGLSDPKELRFVDSATLAAIGAEMHLDPPELARLQVAVGRLRAEAQVESGDALREYFSEKEKRERERWRAVAQRLEAERKAISARSVAELRTEFLNMGKSHLLTPDDVICGTYLLFADEAGRKFLAGTLCERRGVDRVKAHNFYVASHMPSAESFLASHGEQLLALQWPLFPPINEFSALNMALLFDATTEVSGGSTKRTPSVYRHSEEVTGGGSLPVQGDGNGNFFVDMGPVETAFGQVFSELNRLSAEKEPKDMAPKLQNIKKLVPEARASVRTARNGGNASRGQGYGPREQGRGRGRGDTSRYGRGRGGVKGGDTEGQDF
jgi:hypothetical protein